MADADGIMRFESDFVVWNHAGIPHDPYWKYFSTQLVVGGVTTSGEEIWRYELTESDYLTFRTGFRDSSGNFLFVAEQSSPEGAASRFYKLDPDGNELWNAYVGYYAQPFAISQDQQNNYILFGTNMRSNPAIDPEEKCPFVMRVSEEGNIQSHDCIVYEAGGYDVSATARLTEGVIAVLLGPRNDLNAPFRLVRVTLDGQILEASPAIPRSNSLSNSEFAMAAISEDTLVLAGRHLNSRTHLTWLDSSYRITKEEVLDSGEIQNYRVRRIIPLGDGTYLLAGPAGSDPPFRSFVARIRVAGEGPRGNVDQPVRMFPNPARDAVIVSFDLPSPETVSLLVHDVAGRSVYRRADTTLPPGSHTLRWNVDTNQGFPVPSGVYLVTLTRGGERETQTVSIVR